MALRRPKPGDQLEYFTRRTVGSGKIMVWRFKGEELANIEYVCPHCGNKGAKQDKFERQKVRMEIAGKKKTVQAFVFTCDKCRKEIALEKWTKGRGAK